MIEQKSRGCRSKSVSEFKGIKVFHFDSDLGIDGEYRGYLIFDDRLEMCEVSNLSKENVLKNLECCIGSTQDRKKYTIELYSIVY